MTTNVADLHGARARPTERLAELRISAAPVTRRLAALASSVTQFGWTLVAIAIGAAILDALLGWEELAILSGVGLVLLGASALFTLGRAELAVDIRLNPPRVAVGEPAAGELRVRNLARRRLLPVPVELPVGSALARFDVPSLASSALHEDAFVVPTSRRAVIRIGPAMSVRGDPLGLFRRELAFSEVTELFVHPRITPLESLSAGFLRDLEGNAAEAISPSDLAFHSLRQYVAGDDRRHVHWRTTARMPEGDLMVRQFLDTRRSHLVVVLDLERSAYSSDTEFELTISASASLAIRAVRDEQTASLVTTGPVVVRGSGGRILDGFSRVETADQTEALPRLAARSLDLCRDASTIVIATGALRAPAEVMSAAARLDSEVRAVALRGDVGARSSVRRAGRLALLTIAELKDLGGLVQGAILN